jgi:hypothetical protein
MVKNSAPSPAKPPRVPATCLHPGTTLPGSRPPHACDHQLPGPLPPRLSHHVVAPVRGWHIACSYCSDCRPGGLT